jgi:Fur family zinc uptake transcriptional regulator
MMSELQNTVEQMLKAMSQKGCRITEQRRSLAALFAQNNTYLSPKEVYQHMRLQYPGISFDTVYRNLRLLSEWDVLEQVYLSEGPKFKASCLTHHHHHLICMQCEKTIAIDYCPMSWVAQGSQDFYATSHRFEVFGYCRDCHAYINMPLN